MHKRQLDRELLLIQAVNFLNNVLYEIKPHQDGIDIYMRHDGFIGISHNGVKSSTRIIY